MGNSSLRVYIETSVISYLVARDSNNSILLGKQQSTREWWESDRCRYESFVSEVVRNEAGRGDATNASLRLEAIEGIIILAASDEAMNLAALLLQVNAVPAKAAEDAAHIAIATVNSMQFLLTWNFRHINNPSKKRLIESVCLAEGFVCPMICTPDELRESSDDK